MRLQVPGAARILDAIRAYSHASRVFYDQLILDSARTAIARSIGTWSAKRLEDEEWEFTDKKGMETARIPLSDRAAADLVSTALRMSPRIYVKPTSIYAVNHLISRAHHALRAGSARTNPHARSIGGEKG